MNDDLSPRLGGQGLTGKEPMLGGDRKIPQVYIELHAMLQEGQIDYLETLHREVRMFAVFSIPANILNKVPPGHIPPWMNPLP